MYRSRIASSGEPGRNLILIKVLRAHCFLPGKAPPKVQVGLLCPGPQQDPIAIKSSTVFSLALLMIKDHVQMDR